MNVQSACEWCGDCLILYPLGSVPAYRLYSTVPLTFLLCVSATDVCEGFEAVQSVPYCSMLIEMIHVQCMVVLV